MGADAALPVAAELTLDIFRNRTVVVVAVAALGEPSIEAFPDGATVHALARAKATRACGPVVQTPPTWGTSAQEWFT